MKSEEETATEAQIRDQLYEESDTSDEDDKDSDYAQAWQDIEDIMNTWNIPKLPKDMGDFKEKVHAFKIVTRLWHKYTHHFLSVYLSVMI